MRLKSLVKLDLNMNTSHIQTLNIDTICVRRLTSSSQLVELVYFITFQQIHNL